MHQSPLIFDRHRVRLHRERAAPDFAAHDFLFREAAERLVDRLDDVIRHFPLALDIGSHNGLLAKILRGRKVETLVHADLSAAMLHGVEGMRVACDEEFLPFAESAFDLVLSVLSLGWVNDVPGALVQLRQALKADGLLLAMTFGGQTLKELREVMTQATVEVEGGAAAQISPFMDVRDAGSLLQRAGFALPVVDSETLKVTYENLFALLRDLRGMGETNALTHARKHFARRATFLRAAELYQERYADAEGRVVATFELVTMTAWKPHASQQKPAQRGTGKVSLKTVFD